jgi:hypothetical protein
MLKHQLGLAPLALAVLTFTAFLTFTAVWARAVGFPRLDLPRSDETLAVRGGHGGFGGGFGHFGGGFGHFGGGFGRFGGFGVRHFGFAPRHAFVRPIHRRVFIHRFPHRAVVIRRFPHRAVVIRRLPRRVVVRRFPRRAFFVGAPIYAYGGGCAWLRHRALVTGSPYWWRRYRWCLGW